MKRRKMEKKRKMKRKMKKKRKMKRKMKMKTIPSCLLQECRQMARDGGILKHGVSRDVPRMIESRMVSGCTPHAVERVQCLLANAVGRGCARQRLARREWPLRRCGHCRRKRLVCPTASTDERVCPVRPRLEGVALRDAAA
jgi:hypothetical protein